MAVPQRFFRLDQAPEQIELPAGLELEAFSPTPARFRAYSGEGAPPLLLYLFWYVFSEERYMIYYVRHQGRVIHFSHVLRRSYKFPFMQPGDLHIGPCWTAADFRGRGIYPAVLSRIAQDAGGRTLWMLTDETNISSQRGIERAGFRPVGSGVKEGGTYRLTRTFDQER